MSDIELLKIDIANLEDIISSLSEYKSEIISECGTIDYIRKEAPLYWNEGSTEDISSYLTELGNDVTKLNNLVTYLDKYISTLRILIEEVREAIQRSLAESEG